MVIDSIEGDEASTARRKTIDLPTGPLPLEEIEAQIIAGLKRPGHNRTEEIRRLRRSFTKDLAGSSPRFVLGLAERLIDRDDMTLRFVAYELVQHHEAASKSLNTTTLEGLGRGIASWGAVDCFACYLSGPAWRERQVPDSLIHRWARSKDRWWRRAALVSTVPLNSKARGGSGEAARTLQICEMLVDDRDDMVVKAMSWALRELAKRDRPAVQAFIRARRTNLAPRVIREVQNKLRAGLKNPRKQS